MRALPALVLLVACGGGPPRPSYPREPVQLVLPLIDGGELAFASLRGKPVVINFFNTWSVASFSDAEEMKRARAAVGGRLELVGVGLDPDGVRFLGPWRDQAQADWWIAAATPDELAETIFGRIQYAPITVILDAGGRIVWKAEAPLPRGTLTRVVQNLETTGRAP